MGDEAVEDGPGDQCSRVFRRREGRDGIPNKEEDTAQAGSDDQRAEDAKMFVGTESCHSPPKHAGAVQESTKGEGLLPRELDLLKTVEATLNLRKY